MYSIADVPSYYSLFCRKSRPNFCKRRHSLLLFSKEKVPFSIESTLASYQMMHLMKSLEFMGVFLDSHQSLWIETKPSLSLPPLGFQRKQLERVGREKGRRGRAWEEDQEEVISELRFFCQNKGFRNSNSTFWRRRSSFSFLSSYSKTWATF